MQREKFLLTQAPFLPDLVPLETEGQDAHRLAFMDERHKDYIVESPIRLVQDRLVGLFFREGFGNRLIVRKLQRLHLYRGIYGY